jgi:hypothetical protein
MSPVAPSPKPNTKTQDTKVISKVETIERAEPTPKKEEVIAALPETSLDLVNDSPAPQKTPAKKVVLTLSFGDDLAEDIRFVSYVRGISLSDYIISKVAPTIDSDVQAVLAARARKRG